MSTPAEANKAAIRCVVCFSLGILATLVPGMFRKGIVPENWIPAVVAAVVLLVFGVAYLRTTTAAESRETPGRDLQNDRPNR